MNIDIQSLHFNANPELVDFVSEKVTKLERLHSGITSCNVYLKLENSATNTNKICELNIHIPGKILFVKRASHSFEEATNEAVVAMKQQLRDNKA